MLKLSKDTLAQRFMNFILAEITKIYVKITGLLRVIDRRLIALSHDTLMAAFSIPIALWIRTGDHYGDYSTLLIVKHTVIYTLIAIGLFLWSQLYRGIWRYVSAHEVFAISLAGFGIALTYSPLMFLLNHHGNMPRSVAIISGFVTIGLMCLSRLIYRSFHDRWDRNINLKSSQNKSRVLLIGSTDQAETFIRDIQRNPAALYTIVGIVDQNNKRVGRHIHGVEILGVLENLPLIMTQLTTEERQPQHIVIADPNFKDQRSIHKILKTNSNIKAELAQLPNMEDFTKSSANGINIKPIQIEDLLGRNPVGLDRQGMSRLIENRRVLVTGAGGTIGGELVRQISLFNPAAIILLDHSEYVLYSIDLEISETHPHVKRSMVLADIADDALINSIFQELRPEIVFHAAALKHVPIAENNPSQTILTNVIGTRNVAEACRRYDVHAMIMISTDKAVFPSSIMGATKRLAESFCQALDTQAMQEKSTTTRFITTRFGNVLGSTGSVVPLFKRQIASGGPVKVTHPEIKRYFMTVQEAVELVLEAATVGLKSSQTVGQIFVLDMGEPIRIADLAEQMIQLAGLRPYDDIKIEFTGLRPGEKLIEELFLSSEKLIQTSYSGLMLAIPAVQDLKILANGIDQLERFARQRFADKAINKLKELVPEYTPTSITA